MNTSISQTDLTHGLPNLPGWSTAKPPPGRDEAAFLSGACLGIVHLLQGAGSVPLELWRARLALQAAEADVTALGRAESAQAIRDAICLLPKGALPGPAGEIGLAWSRASARPLSTSTLARALPRLPQDLLDRVDALAPGAPVAQAAAMIAAAREAAPRDIPAARLLADAALARSLGWTHLVPLLGLHLKTRALQTEGAALSLACHHAVCAAAREAVPLAHHLARRARKLHEVAPKLRAKASGAVLERFLAQDATSPAMLNDLMSDRAARRICERLVGLGAVRELTGRDTFRLYGL